MNLLVKLFLLFLLANRNKENLKINDNLEESHKIIEKRQVEKKDIDKTQSGPIGDEPIGYLTIPIINVNNKLYEVTSKHNNIEENVTILKKSMNLNDNNSLLILAAHSGTGKIAYFNNLNKLKIKDEINITYYNNNFIFEISTIEEQPKNGYININQDNRSTLILTTCSPTNKERQLIIESKLKGF